MNSGRRAADVLLGGGVIAGPTEGVYGLSCMPDDPDALLRLLAIKGRDPRKGLILVAESRHQLDDWIGIDSDDLPPPDPQQPVTWVVPAAGGVSRLIRGDHDTVAVRLTTNPVMASLCRQTESALVSTSANLSGQRTARNAFILRRKFGGIVDAIVAGRPGPATGPSEIRMLASDDVVRAAS